MQRKAYGKINLGLRVLERRPDGYHNIETVFHRVDLFDELTFESSDCIEVVSTDAAAPGGEANLCHRAASLLHETTGCRKGVRISLTKRIPVGAGLGGGSSDAAVVLQELPRFWDAEVDPARITGLALRLGSDVPYFLGVSSALAYGRGEILEYFLLDVPFTVLLCCPEVRVSTSWAYRQVVPRAADGRTDLKSLLLRGMKDPRLLREEIVNDFERAVCSAYPEVSRIKERMLAEGAVFASMSGSGSAVYGLFENSSSAAESADRFRRQGHTVSLTPPHFRPATPA